MVVLLAVLNLFTVDTDYGDECVVVKFANENEPYQLIIICVYLLITCVCVRIT